MSTQVTYRYRCAGYEQGQQYLTYFCGRANGPPGYPWEVYEKLVRIVRQSHPAVSISHNLPQAVKLTQAKRYDPFLDHVDP